MLYNHIYIEICIAKAEFTYCCYKMAAIAILVCCHLSYSLHIPMVEKKSTALQIPSMSAVPQLSWM
jgi:hypothetical protein